MANNLLLKSPLDGIPVKVVSGPASADAQDARERIHHWKPSRFNAQVTTDEGWLLLWNSYVGAMNAFRPVQRDAVVKLISQNGVSGRAGGVASYLAERGYLVPANVDELRRVRYDFGRENHRTDKLELILLASEDCNFRCTYCYEDFRRGTMQPAVREGLKRLVESRLNVLRALKIGWFGGEPLYGMEAIEDLAPFFAAVAEREKLDFKSHITTNGYLLTADVVDRLLAWRITDYQITIDGSPEDHDRHRPARDGSGTFQKIFDNLAAMKERRDDFWVFVRVNYDRSNAPGLTKFFDLFAKTFGDDQRFTVSLHPVLRWGGSNDANLPICAPDESRDVQMKMKAAARALGLHVSGEWRPNVGVGTSVCYAARSYNFVVGAAGQVMKCTVDLDRQDHNVVGKVLPDGTLELDSDKMALWTEPAFERDTQCQSCHVLAACQGMHCPKFRIDEGKRLCAPIRRAGKQEMTAFFQATGGVKE